MHESMTSPIPGHEWVLLLSLLVTTWHRALKDDVSVFPNLSPTWRALVVGVIGVVAGAVEQASTGGNFGKALLVLLATAGPSLTWLVIEAVRGPKAPATGS